MATANPPIYNHDQQVRLVWTVLAIVVGVTLIAALADYIQHHRSTPSTLRPSAPTATPQSFSDFIGSVSAVNGPVLTVDVVINDQAGQPHLRSYQVTTSPQTTIKSVSGTKLGELTLADVAVGDHVQVAADEDLSMVDHFIATKLFKIVHP